MSHEQLLSMIDKETALQVALSANQANKHQKGRTIDGTDIWYFQYENIWHIKISFDEYNSLGDQCYVVYHVDTETGEVSSIFI